MTCDVASTNILIIIYILSATVPPLVFLGGAIVPSDSNFVFLYPRNKRWRSQHPFLGDHTTAETFFSHQNVVLATLSFVTANKLRIGWLWLWLLRADYKIIQSYFIALICKMTIQLKYIYKSKKLICKITTLLGL